MLPFLLGTLSIDSQSTISYRIPKSQIPKTYHDAAKEPLRRVNWPLRSSGAFLKQLDKDHNTSKLCSGTPDFWSSAMGYQASDEVAQRFKKKCDAKTAFSVPIPQYHQYRKFQTSFPDHLSMNLICCSEHPVLSVALASQSVANSSIHSFI